MCMQEVPFSNFKPELPQCLHKRGILNVSNRSSKLNDTNIRLLFGFVHWNPGQTLDPRLYRMGQVRNDLHHLAKIISSAFSVDYMLVYLASCNIVIFSQVNLEVSLIVS